MTRLDNPRRRITRPWRVVSPVGITTYSTEDRALNRAAELVATGYHVVVTDRTNPHHFTVLRPMEIA